MRRAAVLSVFALESKQLGAENEPARIEHAFESSQQFGAVREVDRAQVQERNHLAPFNRSRLRSAVQDRATWPGCRPTARRPARRA